MRFLDYCKARKPGKNTAKIAKERLQIIVAHQRSELEKGGKEPEYIAQLQQEILAVIKKYVHVGHKDIKIEFDNSGDCSVLELNVTIPDQVKDTQVQMKKA